VNDPNKPSPPEDPDIWDAGDKVNPSPLQIPKFVLGGDDVENEITDEDETDQIVDMSKQC